MTEPTIRQLEVLIAWIECGNSAGAGKRLGITSDRVRAVNAEVIAVFGVRTSAQAFALAVQEGFIDLASVNVKLAA